MSVNLQAIGLSGIAAAEDAMAVVESNITNASNTNYSVESLGFQTTTGANGAGNGVAVLPTVRAEAPMLTEQINGTQSTQSYDQQFSQVTTVAQQIVAPASGDLSSSAAKCLQRLQRPFFAAAGSDRAHVSDHRA